MRLRAHPAGEREAEVAGRRDLQAEGVLREGEGLQEKGKRNEERERSTLG